MLHMNPQPLNGFHSLSVIVLVVNETRTLTETVNTIISVCGRNDLAEIIICPAHFVTPACLSAASELCEKYREVPVSIHMQTGSFEAAMKELFQIVKGSHFIIQPADLEEDPKMLSVFIKKCKEHPDAVITGSRFLSKSSARGFNFIKRTIISVYHCFFKMLYAHRLTDTTFMYSAIPTSRINSLVLVEKSYSVLYEAFLKLLRTGVDVIEVPVEYHKSRERKSKVKFFKDGLRYVQVLFRVRFAHIGSFGKGDDERAD